jgi:hypothetical protein
VGDGGKMGEGKKEQNRTKLQKEAMIKALTVSLGVATPALEETGISRNTYYAWLREGSDIYDPEFKKRVESINLVKDDFIERSLHKLVKDGDTAATIYASKARLGKRGYSEKHTHELTGAGGGPLNVNINFVGPDKDDK